MGRLGPGVPGFLMTKAQLIVVEGGGVPMSLKFQYNPEKFNLQKGATWTRPPATENASTAEATYQSTGPRTVTMDILFDRFSEPFGDVSDDVETLFTWTKPCPVKRNGVYNPPALRFLWGSGDAVPGFKCYLSNVTASYTMFRVDGTPIRATANLTLEELPETVPGTNPTSGTKNALRSHTVIEGETLHSIAWAEYGQARYWRPLAEFNGIDDPLRLEPGTELLLPSGREAARMA